MSDLRRCTKLHFFDFVNSMQHCLKSIHPNLTSLQRRKTVMRIYCNEVKGQGPSTSVRMKSVLSHYKHQAKRHSQSSAAHQRRPECKKENNCDKANEKKLPSPYLQFISKANMAFKASHPRWTAIQRAEAVRKLYYAVVNKRRTVVEEALQEAIEIISSSCHPFVTDQPMSPVEAVQSLIRKRRSESLPSDSETDLKRAKISTPLDEEDPSHSGPTSSSAPLPEELVLNGNNSSSSFEWVKFSPNEELPFDEEEESFKSYESDNPLQMNDEEASPPVVEEGTPPSTSLVGMLKRPFIFLQNNFSGQHQQCDWQPPAKVSKTRVLREIIYEYYEE